MERIVVGNSEKIDNTDKTEIIIHADDFGACKEVTENIMDVFRDAHLTSVSILVNGHDFDRAMNLLKGNPTLKYSIHFNITEGHCVADAKSVSLLVNEKGMFNKSFFSILMKSYLPGLRELKEQIKAELDAQLDVMLKTEEELGIARFKEADSEKRVIRVDSHQHFHMIPMVLRCILEICEERDIEIEYLRIPSEPLGPIFKEPKQFFTYRPINFIKNRVLSTLAVINHRKLKPFYEYGKSSLFFGMIMSCEMDTDRAGKLLPYFKKQAKKNGRILEILAHPGQCLNEDELMDKDNELCKEFYMSEKRMVEKEFLLGLK